MKKNILPLSKYQQAFNNINPHKELLSLAEEHYFLMPDRQSIIDELDFFCDTLSDELQVNIVLDVMTIIDGWCSPKHAELFNPEKRAEEIQQNLKATQDLSIDDFLIALGKIQNSIPKIQKQLLSYHYHHHSLTREALASSVGVSNSYVNIAYGSFGHRLSKELHFPPVITRKADGSPIWRSIFAKKQNNELVLKDNFGQAIKLLAWV